MKRKFAVVVLFAVVMLALSGCQCRHEWVAADCVTPKTCAKCGETEGEVLGHSWQDASCEAPRTCARCGATEGEPVHQWKEANYQDPQTCTLCGAAEGEPLTPSFAKHGLPQPYLLSDEGWNGDTGLPYVTTCYENTSKKTEGMLFPSNYRVFESDETHEGKEGYEWRAVHITITFDDKNAYDDGYMVRNCNEDWYTIEKHDQTVQDLSDTLKSYTVNYHGVDYPDCLHSFEFVEKKWVNRVAYWDADFYFRVPVGYDGAVLGFYDGGIAWEDGMYIYDVADENTLFFRLD